MWIPDAKVGGSTPPVGSFLLLWYEQGLSRTQGYGSNERKALDGWSQDNVNGSGDKR